MPDASAPAGTRGASYIVPCSSRFRDRVADLAARRGASAADLARAVLLLVGPDQLARVPDPGEPDPADREAIELRSGASRGRVLKRKPRIQMRLPAGYRDSDLRRALALALQMAEGEAQLALVTASDRRAEAAVEKARDGLAEENATLRQLVSDLATPVLERGITGRSDALFVLGFPPTAVPDPTTVKRRWRRLAMIYHPDSAFGDHERMSQLNLALSRLLG
ncbi:molecular chaperone DnaJ [Thalassobaculum fulvum]|uniref:Molecular chaperone DnaJ n=1 Tax=Thalassobaculum fulvum TaxID=1633335 RepID=A0A918XNM6_9PROT|nr:J domain-containing protein [Thalassobaculum fulvum]GHD41480.1 molecular chaperone DnaJ [Thalassobaculum fulvum]